MAAVCHPRASRGRRIGRQISSLSANRRHCYRHDPYSSAATFAAVEESGPAPLRDVMPLPYSPSATSLTGHHCHHHGRSASMATDVSATAAAPPVGSGDVGGGYRALRVRVVVSLSRRTACRQGSSRGGGGGGLSPSPLSHNSSPIAFTPSLPSPVSRCHIGYYNSSVPLECCRARHESCATPVMSSSSGGPTMQDVLEEEEEEDGFGFPSVSVLSQVSATLQLPHPLHGHPHVVHHACAPMWVACASCVNDEVGNDNGDHEEEDDDDDDDDVVGVGEDGTLLSRRTLREEREFLDRQRRLALHRLLSSAASASASSSASPLPSQHGSLAAPHAALSQGGPARSFLSSAPSPPAIVMSARTAAPPLPSSSLLLRHTNEAGVVRHAEQDTPSTCTSFTAATTTDPSSAARPSDTVRHVPLALREAAAFVSGNSHMNEMRGRRDSATHAQQWEPKGQAKEKESLGCPGPHAVSVLPPDNESSAEQMFLQEMWTLRAGGGAGVAACPSLFSTDAKATTTAVERATPDKFHTRDDEKEKTPAMVSLFSAEEEELGEPPRRHRARRRHHRHMSGDSARFLSDPQAHHSEWDTLTMHSAAPLEDFSAAMQCAQRLSAPANAPESDAVEEPASSPPFDERMFTLLLHYQDRENEKPITPASSDAAQVGAAGSMRENEPDSGLWTISEDLLVISDETGGGVARIDAVGAHAAAPPPSSHVTARRERHRRGGLPQLLPSPCPPHPSVPLHVPLAVAAAATAATAPPGFSERVAAALRCRERMNQAQAQARWARRWSDRRLRPLRL